MVGITGKKTIKGMQNLTNFFSFFLMIPIGYQRKNAMQGILENGNICSGGI
jgi:hypothetical protein